MSVDSALIPQITDLLGELEVGLLTCGRHVCLSCSTLPPFRKALSMRENQPLAGELSGFVLEGPCDIGDIEVSIPVPWRHASDGRELPEKTPSLQLLGPWLFCCCSHFPAPSLCDSAWFPVSEVSSPLWYDAGGEANNFGHTKHAVPLSHIPGSQLLFLPAPGLWGQGRGSVCSLLTKDGSPHATGDGTPAR